MDVDDLAGVPAWSLALRLGSCVADPLVGVRSLKRSAPAVVQHRVRDKRFQLGPARFGGWGLAPGRARPHRLAIWAKT
jgi:hypothetical protein